MTSSIRALPLFVAIVSSTSLACSSSDSSGAGASGDTGGAAGTGGSTGSGATGVGGAGAAGGATGSGGVEACADVAPPDEVLPDTTDPEAGDFTLDEALAELPEGPGPLRATIETELGTITCTLAPEVAPNGVANFVGLARGRRAWKDPATCLLYTSPSPRDS